MDSETIWRLALFNICFDIAIDEEDFDSGDARLLVSRKGGSARRNPYDVDEDDLVFPSLLRSPQRALVASLRSPEWAVDIDPADPTSAEWHRLFAMKLMRALAQKKAKTPRGVLDEIGRFAISHLPDARPERAASVVAMKTGDREAYEMRKLLRLLYLNEASACSKRSLSLGYSEMVLSEINKASLVEIGEAQQGVNVYELLALLNQGIAHAHVHRHEDALTCLDQVIDGFRDWPGLYATSATEFTCGKVRAADEVFWRRYVLLPAVLQKAEVLADLNRSTEQMALFSQHREDFALSAYLSQNRDLLILLAETDSWQGTGPTRFARDSLSGLSSSRGKPALRQKYQQAKLTYEIRRLENALRNGALPRQRIRDLEDGLDTYLGYAIKYTIGNQDEVRDAYGLNIHFFSVIARSKRLDALEAVDRRRALRVLGYAARRFFQKNERFPDPDESRKRLLRALEEFGRQGSQADEFREIEKKTRRALLKRSEDMAAVECAQHARRLQELGARPGNLAGAERYALPSPRSRLLTDVLMSSRRVFCEENCINSSDGACKATSDGSLSPEQARCRAWSYQQWLEENSRLLAKRLRHGSAVARPTGYWLTTLRRWQSYTPALARGGDASSKGGGYFLYRTGEEDGQWAIRMGVAVDPGFDFLANFLSEGFSIGDIHAVFLTHSHVDHTVDFAGLVTLLHEWNSVPGNREAKRILAVMPRGCFEQHERLIARNRELFLDVVVVRPEDRFSALPGLLRDFHVTVTQALHDDLTGHDSVGYVFSAPERQRLIGFTGDTRWWKGLDDPFRDVPVLLANLGGIVKAEEGIDEKPQQTIYGDLLSAEGLLKILRKENHLYWPGLNLLLGRLRSVSRALPQLVILTEIPEEMGGGLKADLARTMNQVIGDARHSFLPEDVGLTVRLPDDASETARVECLACRRLIPAVPGQIEMKQPADGEGLHYVCRACAKYREPAVVQAIARHSADGSG